MDRKYQIRDFSKEDAVVWNAFVSNSPNATFLFNRNFMDYHSDRFSDFSLMIFSSKKLVAILPANRVGDAVYSHQGLTYGGLVVTAKTKVDDVITILKEILKYLEEHSIKFLQIKIIPSIYCKSPSDAIEYALYLAKAKLIRRESGSAIDLNSNFKYSTQKKYAISVASKKELSILENSELDVFYNSVLIPNLENTFSAKPVHSLEEMQGLQKAFPKNIRNFFVYHENVMVAGAILFETETVVHTQYISADKSKMELNALNFLFDYLIKDVFASKKYFDFGTSNMENGQKLNAGLAYWKESFGARTYVQDCYEVETANYKFLNDVFI